VKLKLLVLALLGASVSSQDQRPMGRQPDGSVLVPTQQVIKPFGTTIEFPGRPTDLRLCDQGRLLLVKSRTELVLISCQDRTVRQRLAVKKDGLSYHGLAVSPDETRVYVTGSHDQLWVAKLEGGKLSWDDPVQLKGPKGRGNSAPGGIALAKGRLYVTLSRNNALGVVDLAGKEVPKEIPVGIAPYEVLVDGNLAYVSNWGGREPEKGEASDTSSGTAVRVDPDDNVASSGTVSIVDLEAEKQIAQIDVGLHPSGLALDAKGRRLFVACANSDEVEVIDLATRKLAHEWKTRPRQDLPFGSSPNALALSRDGKTLWVCLGTNNAVLALDAATGAQRGALPVGWYPGACLFDAKGGTLYVANTKGVGSLERSAGNSGFRTHNHTGSVTILTDLSAQAFAAGAAALAEQNRWSHLELFLAPPRAGQPAVPLPERHGEPSLLEHVVYVIKENRTYDQVFGDIEKGNGDKSLCTFGIEVTPNQHALADEFVLLDNFYCSGVLSADGHQWTNEAFVTDYIEKSFGGFARSYPFDGDDPLAYASSGFLWDNALRHKKTFRCYGEMVHAKIEPGGSWQDLWEDREKKGGKFKITAHSAIDAVQKNLCPTYIGFPLTVSDQYRADEFLKELAAFEEKGTFPSLVMMLLPNDHTSGTRPNVPKPQAMVADNDLALGRIVEALTKSRFWGKLCIFVVEDDPQNGWDHVDAHRTIGQVISPYTKRGATVSTRYTQVDMVKSIELILGLPPMNQLDLCGVPMRECFTEKADLRPFQARKATTRIDDLNPEPAKLEGKQKQDALRSLALDLDEPDKADEDTLNRILWHAIKGHGTPYPK
jgi:YVTN family beta-propeller protein